MLLALLPRLGKWPPYKPEHQLLTHKLATGPGFWVGYRSEPGFDPHGSTHFDLNVYDNVCFLLNIEVDKKWRGGGHGAALYLLIEEAAREVGCNRIQTTPSGHTFRGESRADYLQRRGWTLSGGEAVKEL